MADKKNGSDFADLCKKDAAILANNMREARKSVTGMSQARMADKLNVTTAYIGRLERCECKIPAYIVKRYCQVLDIPPEDLMETGVSPLPDGTDEEILNELQKLEEEQKSYILGLVRSLKKK